MITNRPNRILVPTDFSEVATHALRYASDLARRTGATLTVLYADRFLPPIDYTASLGVWDDTTFALLEARATEQLHADAETNIDPSVPFDAVVRVAAPIDGILSQARESGAGMIVMGTHGRSGFRRLVIGSVTEEVMRRAEVPVIAVPPAGMASPSMLTILCPVIYNSQCFDALEFAATIAPPDARFIVARAATSEQWADMDRDLTDLREWVPASIASRADFKLLMRGHVAEQVEHYARIAHADLIVTSEQLDRSATDRLQGSFAERLMQHSDCPVLTVNARAARTVAHGSGSVMREQTRRTVPAHF
jgi:nucleotide-binding universal stress UspA family protein